MCRETAIDRHTHKSDNTVYQLVYTQGQGHSFSIVGIGG